MRNRLAATLLSVLLGAAALSAAQPAQAVTPARPDTLLSGQSLVGHSTRSSLISLNGAFGLSVADFMVTIEETETNASHDYSGTGTWFADGDGAPGLDGHDNSVLSMQTDGNLVLYTSKHRVIWQSHTAGKGKGDRLVLEPLGNLVIISSANQAIWSTGSGRAMLGSGKALASNASLIWVWPHDCPTRLQMQGDGNLVLSVRGRVTWQSHSHSPGAHLGLRTNGDLAIFAARTGGVVWATHTPNRSADSWLELAGGMAQLDNSQVSGFRYWTTPYPSAGQNC
ncbi:MAG: hypothetical protein M3Y42_02885 [Actinomycetota bacterium]|nr:hypothetical protein [Actinomycetota bacterium]MDQ2955893.1 hypothetical protein [Actinomycetota bacterium]